MTDTARPLSPAELRGIDAYWRAANYLAVGAIFLKDNPLLRRPLERAHVKPRMLGHWGTAPGLNLVYAHANRLIRERDMAALFVAGPGHGGPAVVANSWLEGTWSEHYPDAGQDEAGMAKLFKRFAWPGGTGSHAPPETPGSIHEGGELGYSLAHAFGAVFDDPDLVAICVVGDGEAETGPLAASWQSNKFLNPARDGAVLPVLHLNGWKIANPTILSRIPEEELASYLRGSGWEPRFVTGDEPAAVHQAMAAAMDSCADAITSIRAAARDRGETARPKWPMIVLRTPKGWTGPKTIDGAPIEGTFRSHQFRMNDMEREGRVELLEGWLKSYRPEELFDEAGAPRPEIAALSPKGERRMSASPRANAGRLVRELKLPDLAPYGLAVPRPGSVDAESTRVQGRLMRDIIRDNRGRFRAFSPDENSSNGWTAVYEAEANCFMDEPLPGAANVSRDGRVMEVLSEHLCEGWLEGYLLTGRHGFFNCYEAFVQIVASMATQHAKWLDMARKVPWRAPIASLNYLLSSHVWRQDHNGFSHQAPGFLDHVINLKPETIRVYLPPDANTLLQVTDAVLRTRGLVNVVVGGKHMAPQWLTPAQAALHADAGIGVWEWAGSEGATGPDVVLACCGDVPTQEILAAAELLRARVPELSVRVVNVMDLMKLPAPHEHPHGLPEGEFSDLFGGGKPVVFAFHGYAGLIHRLIRSRGNSSRFEVRGFKEEGS